MNKKIKPCQNKKCEYWGHWPNTETDCGFDYNYGMQSGKIIDLCKHYQPEQQEEINPNYVDKINEIIETTNQQEDQPEKWKRKIMSPIQENRGAPFELNPLYTTDCINNNSYGIKQLFARIEKLEKDHQ